MGGIGIVDVETSGAYFSSFRSSNLYFLDINNQAKNNIYEFSPNEEIIYINCRFNDSLISINTFNKNENIYKYYIIDKLSHEKITEGIGQLFATQYNNYVKYNNSKIYIINDPVNPTLNIEVSVERNKIFSRAIGIHNNTFIFTHYSTTPILWADFLFSGSNKREHYDYWIVNVNSNESDIEYLRIFRNNTSFTNKVFFDAIILDGNEYDNK
jgi:hypothetical protein